MRHSSPHSARKYRQIESKQLSIRRFYRISSVKTYRLVVVATTREKVGYRLARKRDWKSLFSYNGDSFHGSVIRCSEDEIFPWVNKSQSRTFSAEITFHGARVLLYEHCFKRFHRLSESFLVRPKISPRVDILRFSITVR